MKDVWRDCGVEIKRWEFGPIGGNPSSVVASLTSNGVLSLLA